MGGDLNARKPPQYILKGTAWEIVASLINIWSTHNSPKYLEWKA